MEDRVYFSNDVHNELIGKVSHLIVLTQDTPVQHTLAVEIHDTLLSEYLQDEVEDGEE